MAERPNVVGFISIVVLCLGDTQVGGKINTTVILQVCEGTINLSEELDYAYAVGKLVALLARETLGRGGESYRMYTNGDLRVYGYASCGRGRALAAEECKEYNEIADMEIYSRCSFPKRAQMVLHDCRLAYSDHQF